MIDLQKLKPIHKEILRRVAQGMKSVEIARELGVHPDTVCNAKCSKLGQAYLEQLDRELDDMSVRVAAWGPLLRLTRMLR